MMSVWVVALENKLLRAHTRPGDVLPKWIANHEKRHVFVRCIIENFVTLCFHHVTVGEDQLFAVKGLLSSQRGEPRNAVRQNWTTNQTFLLNHENACVGF